MKRVIALLVLTGFLSSTGLLLADTATPGVTPAAKPKAKSHKMVHHKKMVKKKMEKATPGMAITPAAK